LENPYAPLGGNPFPFQKDPATLKFAPGSNYSFQSPDHRSGYVQQYNFSIQRQIGADWSVETAYVGNVGRKLLSQIDINYPLRVPGASGANVNQRRPLWPVFQTMNERSGFVNSSYNALQTRVEKRFSQGLTLLGSYTLGKWLDDSSWFDDTTLFADQRNIRLDRGRGEQDQRQVFALSWVWELPWSGRLLGGWSVNGIASFYSGQPLRMTSGRDNDFDGNGNNDRPDVAGDWKLSPNRTRSDVVQAWFNPRAFTSNQAGQPGTLGRNVVSGPGFKGVDLGVTKSFRLTERHHVQFRAESFNAFNWVNLGSPITSAASALFGRITSTSVGTTAASVRRDARIFQVGLKYLF
jgi:hypothetical protein